MKKILTVLFVMGMVMAVPVLMATAAVENNKLAPDFTLTDSNGKQHHLVNYRGKYVVLEWVNYQCPFVMKHYSVGHMQNLQEKVIGEDIIWLSINSSAKGNQGYYEPEELNQIIEDQGAKPTAYLVDTDGKVGKTYGAKTTPHMFIISPEGKLIYQGAIDSIASFDSADIAKADNYVLKALSETMAGSALSNPSTKSYGCSVKY